MALVLIPWRPTYLDTSSGSPVVAAGYQLFTYESGTSTKLATYQDSDGSVANTNPIVLDSAGQADVYVQAQAYKLVLASPTDTDPPASPIWTQDNVLPWSPVNLDLDYSDGVAGETVAVRESVYCSDGSGSKTAGRWYLTDADNTYSSTTASAMGVVVTGGDAGDTLVIRIMGRMTGYTGLSAGQLYYLSATAGALTTTAPTNARPFAVADTTTSIVLTQWAAPTVASASVAGIVSLADQTLGDGQKTFKQVPLFNPGVSDSTASGRTLGVINVDTTSVGNVGAGEDTLMTYTLPANTLDGNGQAVRVTAWGTTANNANAKTIKLYFGSTSATLQNASATAGNNIWKVVAEFVRTGAATQVGVYNYNRGTGAYNLEAIGTNAPTEDTTAAIVIKVTGEAVATDDIIELGLIIESL